MAASAPAGNDIETVSGQPQGQTVAMASLALLAEEFSENIPCFHGLTGRSPVMRQLMSRMQRMAPHLAIATLEGEEGTGRTLAASALHAAGPAAYGPFVPCLASEFFIAPEHSGMPAWSTDLLGKAHRGLLFLDRVHRLSPEQQESLATFLRWFEDRHAYGPQNASAGSVDGVLPTANLPAQIVFSSSVPLWGAPSAAGFRADLASRLWAVRFRLPPLRERREDIPLLAQIFIQRFARASGKTVRGLGPGTIAPLLRHAWPGNVRELENVIAAAALETEGQWIRPIDLPPLSVDKRKTSAKSDSDSVGSAGAEADLNLDQAIRNHVARALDRTRGNKLRAAQLLGISRSTLYRILAAEDSVLDRKTPATQP